MDSTLQLQSNVLNFYSKNPRMVPDDLQPSCHKMHITVKEPAQKATSKNDGKKKSTFPQITSEFIGKFGLFEQKLVVIIITFFWLLFHLYP